MSCLLTDTGRSVAGLGQRDGREITGYGEIVERILAGVLLVVLSPIILLCMVVIKLTSRGPAIYKQQRVGLGGRVFTLYKLRTMCHNCEKETGPIWSCPGDPRVTLVGRFLRWSHLDELPQLLNIIRGEMSFVGPRPERREFVQILVKHLPGYAARLSVKPGITGLAQIQLPPDTDLVSVRKKLVCDLYYVHNRNTCMNLRIIMATALRMLGCPVWLVLSLLRLPPWYSLALTTSPHTSNSSGTAIAQSQ